MAKPIQGLSLKKANIQGFRSIDNIDVGFKRGLNILIGKNGVGKSNLLYILNEALGPTGLLHETSVKKMSVTLESEDKKNVFRADFMRKSIKPEDIQTASSSKFFIDRSYFLNDIALSSAGLNNKVVQTNGIQPFMRTYNYGLKGTGLRFPQADLIEYKLPDPIPYLDLTAALVVDIQALVLDSMDTLPFLEDIFWILDQKLFDDISTQQSDIDIEAFAQRLTIDYLRRNLVFEESLVEALRKYTPIEDIRFNPNINLYQSDHEFIIDNIKVDFLIKGSWYPWSYLSDGTKRLFYIIAQVDSLHGGVVFLEEPELGVHPHQLHLLMEYLTEQSEKSQIILSTHSPLVLDHLTEDQLDRILIVSHEKERGTQARRMSDTEIKKAKAYMEEVGYLSDYWTHSDLEK